MLEHDVGDADGELVNAGYIKRLLAQDWGFYHTVTTNLDRVEEHLGDYSALDKPRRAVTPGRALVLYEDDVVLAGATITATVPAAA